MKNKTYLVTGAAGFIGAAVAKRLVEKGSSVITVDNLSTGFKNNIPKGVKFIEGDCQNEKVINKLSNYEFDAIFHIAGQSSGEISFDNPSYDLQTNAQSTLLLLKLALNTNCNKFIYASTMSVYGDQEKMPVNEKAVLYPKSFYGVGKIASEHYLRIYQEFGINSTSLRLFNVYGPGQNMHNLKQGMVSIFLEQALSSQKIHVKGDKNRFRDFVYIDDVVDAFLCANNKKFQGFKVYNVSSCIKTTIEELISNMLNNLSYKVQIKYEGSTPGDQFGIYGENSLIKKELGWIPKYQLDEGIKEMVKWAKQI
tara:strand:- start:303 stop:1232 length:930 start_codon:yes stop_codon:yes gene_type:complete